MIEYPKLYSRTSTGKVQEWQLFVEYDSFWCVYGQVDGKKITGAKTVCTGKNIGKANETSPTEQAIREAEAEFVKKKSQKDYFEDIADIDNETFFSPQLAKGYEDRKDKINLATGKWASEPKLDGVRSVIHWKGAFSRNGKPFVSFPHIYELLKPHFDKIPVWDGEVYAHAYRDNFNKIISLAKQSKPTQQDIDDSAQLLEYWVFDCGNLDLPFSERRKLIEKVVAEINDPRIKITPFSIVKSESEVEAKLAEYLEEGFEGAMLKNLDALYQNKRTGDVLKYKLFMDQEFKIIDITEGVGNRAEKFGRATLITDEGITFDANARGDEAFYMDLWFNKQNYIGKMATIRFQNWTPGPKSKPRFPVMVAIRDYD